MPSSNAEPVEVAVTRCHQCLTGSSRVAGVDAVLRRHQPADRLAAVYDKAWPVTLHQSSRARLQALRGRRGVERRP